MLKKLTQQDQRVSRTTYNELVEAANSFDNIGVGNADINYVGNPSIVTQEQPEPGCWAIVTAIVTDTYGNFLRDSYCRLQYDWFEQERWSPDGVNVFWRNKVQSPRHSIPLDNGSQHPLREINGKPLVIGRRYWIYPGMLLFNGPTPTANASNWEHLTVASPQKPIRVKTNEDWYACGCITGTQQTVSRCGTVAQSCPPVESCPSCESCSACDSCPDPSCESCSCPSVPESSSGPESGSVGSSGEDVPSGVTTVCLGVTPCGSCPTDDIHSPQVTCDDPIYLADPLGTISEANLYAEQDVNGVYFVPAGTYLYVEHLDDAYSEDGYPLYEPTGGWGQGCACTAVPCPTASCVECPSCGTSCSCPGSCPSCGSCISASGSQSASHSIPQDPRKCPNGAEAGWHTDSNGNCYWGCPACSTPSSGGGSSGGGSGSF